MLCKLKPLLMYCYSIVFNGNEANIKIGVQIFLIIINKQINGYILYYYKPINYTPTSDVPIYVALKGQFVRILYAEVFA